MTVPKNYGFYLTTKFLGFMCSPTALWSSFILMLGFAVRRWIYPNNAFLNEGLLASQVLVFAVVTASTFIRIRQLRRLVGAQDSEIMRLRALLHRCEQGQKSDDIEEN